VTGRPLLELRGPTIWWEYGLHLSCGHVLPLGRVINGEEAWWELGELPSRKDGWYAAQKCLACHRKHAVTASFASYSGRPDEGAGS
jgi:hypothetical protein